MENQHSAFVRCASVFYCKTITRSVTFLFDSTPLFEAFNGQFIRRCFPVARSFSVRLFFAPVLLFDGDTYSISSTPRHRIINCHFDVVNERRVIFFFFFFFCMPASDFRRTGRNASRAHRIPRARWTGANETRPFAPAVTFGEPAF